MWMLQSFLEWGTKCSLKIEGGRDLGERRRDRVKKGGSFRYLRRQGLYRGLGIWTEVCSSGGRELEKATRKFLMPGKHEVSSTQMGI